MALPVRLSGLSVTQLPAWLAISVVSHVLILAAGINFEPATPPDHPAVLHVDIAPVPDMEQSTAIKPSPASEAPLPATSTRTTEPSEPTRKIQHRPLNKGLLPIENYFSVNEVDVRAEPINEVLLRYPWLEYRRRLSGVVSFRLYISAEGTLDKAELIESVPPGHFEEAAREAVHKLQFSPARKNGRPVNSQKTIDVVFDPDETLDGLSSRPPAPSAAGK